jgi:predicted RNase H-like HicB family nuclease
MAANTTTPLGRRLVRLMRMAGMTGQGVGLAPLSHRLFLPHEAGRPPSSFNVDLAPDDAGTFLVSCRELPEVMTFGRDEEEALEMARCAIMKALSARPAAPEFPN